MSDNEQNNEFQAKYRSWIVNIDEPLEGRRISDWIEKDKFEFKNPSRKTKRSEEEYRHYSGYNIKKVTKSKTVKHIDEMIQDELGLSDKSVRQWDHLVSMLSSMNFGNQVGDSIKEIEPNEGINEDDANDPILPDPRELLLARSRWERITFEQKKLIYKLIKDDEVPIHIIRDKFSLSESTIKRILKMFEEWEHIVRPDTSKIGIKIFKSKKIKEATIDFIWNQETPFTSKDVCAYLKDQFGVDIDSRTTARYMKNSLSMSFKKASSRPIQIDTLRIHRLKALYSIVLAKQLDSWEWIVNIDESSFSRLTKQNYTWLLKGIPGSTKNIQFSGSINLISAISTTGVSYTAIAKQTTDS